MPQMTPNVRANDDAKIIESQAQARKLCSKRAHGWDAARAACFARDRNNRAGCARCGGVIDWTLKYPHAGAPTVDHMGVQVADVVGMPKGRARRLLHQVDQLRTSHSSCNTRDGRGIDREPDAQPKVQPSSTHHMEISERYPADYWSRDNDARWELFQLSRGSGVAKHMTEAERRQRSHDILHRHEVTA